MNTKRVFALLLGLLSVFSLFLLTPTETKAEGFESSSTEIEVDWYNFFLSSGIIRIQERL